MSVDGLVDLPNSLPIKKEKLAVISEYADEYHPISATVLKWFVKLGIVAATMVRSSPCRNDTMQHDATAIHSRMPVG